MNLEPGNEKGFVVKAHCRWNETGVILQRGCRYDFRIVEVHDWMDWFIRSGPEGYKSENLLMRSSEYFRRIPDAPWFALIGTIKKNLLHSFKIGSGLIGFEPPISGPLYCFANDVPFMYFNNRGELQVVVNRTM